MNSLTSKKNFVVKFNESGANQATFKSFLVVNVMDENDAVRVALERNPNVKFASISVEAYTVPVIDASKHHSE